MTSADILTILGGVGAPLTLIGGGVAFMFNRVDKLDERVKVAEEKYAKLEIDHGRLMVQVDRWRIAFKMVAAALREKDPNHVALQTASEMLSERPPVFARGDDVALEAQLSRLEQPEADL